VQTAEDAKQQIENATGLRLHRRSSGNCCLF